MGEGTERSDETVVAKLKRIIASLPSDKVTVATIFNAVGEEGVLLLSLLLCIIFMVPVSIPGVSTVFGAAILLGGMSRVLGGKLWLPSRVAERMLPADRVKAGLERGLGWMRRLERISRPYRFERFIRSATMTRFSDFGVVLGAILLMAPFGFIPFSNTLPALAILLLCLGLLQRDGLCILFGHLMNLASMIYFAIILIGGLALVKNLWVRLIGALFGGNE